MNSPLKDDPCFYLLVFVGMLDIILAVVILAI
jgi:hypothetical protein